MNYLATGGYSYPVIAVLQGSESFRLKSSRSCLKPLYYASTRRGVVFVSEIKEDELPP